MNHCKLLSFSFILVCANITNSYSQHYMAVETSDWSVINSMYLNPANIAGSHEKYVLNLFSLNVGVDNSLGTFNQIGGIANSLKANQSVFNNSGRSTFNMIIPSMEVRGPGLMVSIDDKQSVAVTTGIRVVNQFNNFNQSLYNVISDPNYVSTGTYNYNAKNFNWTAHLWSEVGLSYGRVIMDDGNNTIKAGITLRYLGGIAYLSLNGNNLDATFTTGNDSFYAANSDIHFASNILSANSAVSKGLTASDLLSRFFGTKSGSGVGADLGVVYQYREDGTSATSKDKADGNGYKLSVSAAVTDLGSVKYKQGNNYIINAKGNGYLTGKGLGNNLDNYSDFRNYMVKQGYTADTASTDTKVHMPTMIALGADYQVYQRFYANLTYLANLVNRNNISNSYYNQLTLTPRYESKLVSVGLPITYSALAGDMKVGLGVRFAGFFIGSDDMLAAISDNQHGFNFYMGGYIPLYRKADKKVKAPKGQI